MKRNSRPFLAAVIVFLALLLVSSCDWIPYIQKQYESKIGQKLVAQKEEPVVEYETGKLVKYDKSKRDAVSRKLYYMGISDSTVKFLWQQFNLSTFSSSTDRTLEKSPIEFELQPFPFEVNVRGFSLMIHDANDSLVTYTLLSADPTDLPDSLRAPQPSPK